MFIEKRQPVPAGQRDFRPRASFDRSDSSESIKSCSSTDSLSLEEPVVRLGRRFRMEGVPVPKSFVRMLFRAAMADERARMKTIREESRD